MVKPAYAQSTKPSAPKFIIQFPNNSTIHLVIENQHFINTSSVNSIVYYYRVKDHYSNQWLLDADYNLQSNSKTSIISIPPVPAPSLFTLGPLNRLNNSTLIDFQVQAVTGYYSITNESGPPALISPAPQNWHMEITFYPAESSDWSNTQTVNLNETSTISTPTLNSTPLLTNNTLFLTVTLSAIGLAIIVILVMVLKRRKSQLTNKQSFL